MPAINKKFVIFLVSIFGLTLAGCSKPAPKDVSVDNKKSDTDIPNTPSAPSIPKTPSIPRFQKGVCYATWNSRSYLTTKSDMSLEAAAKLGVEYVGLVTTWYQDSIDSKKIAPLAEKTPDDESIIHAIDKIHASGMKVNLKLHLDLVKSDGHWRGEIGSSDDGAWQEWFAGYTDFLLHYARIAQAHNVEILCIGTELTNSTVSKPDAWREMIKKVREIYGGQLTYAANWSQEYEGIKFWNDLDYIGIDAYFPLTDKDVPTLEELNRGWQDWVTILERWYTQSNINKPIVFLEIGYKSCPGSAISPWEHMPQGEAHTQLQSDATQALFETFWDKPYFFGVYWWYWGTAVSMGGEANRGFCLQNKPASEIIAKWYALTVDKKFPATN